MELDASEIEVRIGATWVEPRYIEDFMKEVFETAYILSMLKIEILSIFVMLLIEFFILVIAIKLTTCSIYINTELASNSGIYTRRL